MPSAPLARLVGREQGGLGGGSAAVGADLKRSGSRGRASMRAARVAVCLARGADPKLREHLVDHRRLTDERDHPYGPVTRRTRERVDLKELLQKRRPATGDLGRREEWRGNDHGRRYERECRLFRESRGQFTICTVH